MKRSIGATTLAYPLPAFLVGTYDAQGKANIMTAAWGGICCSEPPCVAVSIRPQRHSFQSILERKAFTISVPSAQQAVETDFAGIFPGTKWDKFAATGFTPVRGEHVDAPYVGECPVVIECELFKTLELGTHTQFVGRIMDVKIEETCLDHNGLPDMLNIAPLVFDAGRGEYYGVGEVVGKAFSIGKALKPAS